MNKRFFRLGVVGTALLLAMQLHTQASASLIARSELSADPAQWRTQVDKINNRLHKDFYPGIDLTLSGSSEQLIAQFIVRPFANINDLNLDFVGVQNVQPNGQIDGLDLASKLNMRLLTPKIFQGREGNQVEIAGQYVQRENGKIGIAVEAYDANQPLFITIETQFYEGHKTEPPASKFANTGTPVISTLPAPSITATKSDEVVPDSDNDGAAKWGETIKYTVVIENIPDVEDATDVDFDDTIDPNTTLVAGSVKTTPLAYNKTLTVLEDAPATATTLLGADPDGNDNANLDFAVTASPSNGVLGSLSPASQFSATTTYTPNSDYFGSDLFTYKVVDQDGNEDEGTADITVVPVNDTPSFTVGVDQTANAAYGIAQTYNNGGLGFGFAMPTLAGQSFTATDATINLSSISYSYLQVNNQLQAPEITMRLYEGSGFSGTLIAQNSVTPSEASPSGTWITFDFSGVTLVSGQTYTFALGTSATGNISGGFEATAINEDVYAGGSRFFPDGTPVGGDLKFQVVGENAIVQPLNNGGLGFGFAAPTLAGQSFTATDATINLSSISYSYNQVNNQLQAPEITMRLYEGSGFSGTLIAQNSVTPSESSPSGTWITFDFSGVTLVSGQTYTFALGTSATGNISGGFEATASNEDLYAGGSRFFPNGTPVGGDLRFRVDGAGPGMSVNSWATNVSPGPANESAQALQFEVTGNTNHALFAYPPAVDASGNLTYTTAVGVSGTATITLELMDDGGVDNGGVDTSPSQTFTINVQNPNP